MNGMRRKQHRTEHRRSLWNRPTKPCGHHDTAGGMQNQGDAPIELGAEAEGDPLKAKEYKAQWPEQAS